MFFDIDGTLLNDLKRVQKSTAQAIRELKKDGILVGLATGRGPSFVAPYMETYGFDFAVTYNGQYVFTRDKTIYANPLTKQTIFKVMNYTQKHRIELSLGTISGLMGSGLISMGTNSKASFLTSFIPKQLGKTVERGIKNGIRRVRPQNYDKMSLLLTEPIYQLVVVATREQTAILEKEFSDLTVTRSSPYSADLLTKGQSKLKGICRLAEHFDFSLDEVMAFGDSENDLEMLANVGVGVAMGNAKEQVKDEAHYTTTDNNKDGIAKALFHYGLIHLDTDQTFQSLDDNFNKVRDFHQLMDGETIDTPQAYTMAMAERRANFKVEEIVEFLYATADGDATAFTQSVLDLHTALDKAAEKVKSKPLTSSNLVGQVDALADLLYFTYASFTLMGVDPKPIFDSVHEANMGKIFPDGKPRFDPVTHKVVKPDDWEERFAPEPAIKRELDRQIRKAQQRQQAGDE